jgi:hypothetical protein
MRGVVPLLILLVLGGAVWSLTVIRGQNGDPLICAQCWVGGHHHHASEGRNPPLYLKTLCSAQGYFRANDSDRDGRNQFWRADVAGLYALAPKGGPAIKLIELRIAAADDRALPHLREFAVSDASSGYWYRAIRHADEDPKSLDPNRFAFCAFPDNPGSGKYIFIVDENNTIYRTLAKGRRGIEVYPTQAQLDAEYSKLD